MFSFFKINDPLRLVGVFFIFVMIRLVFFLRPVPMLIPELNWLLIGEKLSEHNLMYVELWDSIAPLSAMIYWAIHQIGGNTILIYHVLAMILVFLQAAFFNQILLQKNVYNDKNYLVALFYVLFSCCSVDMLTLSPPLISLTFLLLVIRNILTLSENAFDNEIFKTGIYLGVAILLYLPNFVFLAFIAIGFLFFRTASTRQYLLFIYGIAVVSISFILYYFGEGKLNYFLQNYLFTILNFNLDSFLSWKTLLITLAVPSIFFLFALLKVFGEGSFINFQSNTQRLLFLWFIIALLSNLFAPTFSTSHLILLAPSFSLFVTYFFLLYKKAVLKEIYILLLIVSIGVGGYLTVFAKGKIADYINYQRVFAQKRTDFAYTKRRILVLGDDISYYFGNQLATPYLNWQLSQAHFANLEYYWGAIAVYENLQKDMPEIIIDQIGIGEKLFAKVQILQTMYERQGKLYFLKQEEIDKRVKNKLENDNQRSTTSSR